MQLERKVVAGIAFVLALGLVPAKAQSAQPAIEARLLKQDLYLRGYWQGKKLGFDAAGNLLGPCSVGTVKHCTDSFTLTGMAVTKVDLQPSGLVLTGNREWIEFQPKPKLVSADSDIEIKIAVPADGDYGPALDKIFAHGLGELVPDLPYLWQDYAYKVFLKQPPPVQPQGVLPAVRSIPPGNNSVLAPVVINTVEPDITSAAARLNYKAIVVVNSVVGTDGKPYLIHVVKPAGLGLDEAAAKAVAQYTFKPATKNGVPINVELNVEVGFFTTY